MKIIHSDIKHGTVKIKTESMDDLYVLSNIIDKGDNVKARTIRKIKIGEDDERKKSIVKKPVTLSIEVEKVEFSKYSLLLKISGKIIDEHEDIPKGSYHSFNIEENSIITINKVKWLEYQLDKLHQSTKSKYGGCLLVIFDRDEGFFVLVERYGYKIISEVKGDVQKKRYLEKHTSNFFQNIIKQIKEYHNRYPSAEIVLASPAFWKEELFELLEQELKQKTILATCSSADRTAIEELINRPELKTVLKNTKIQEESEIVNNFLREISMHRNAVYGLKETQYCANIGAVELLLVTDGFILKVRQENNYDAISNIMRNVESMKGKVAIISSENQAGKSLDALRGIGAILRYKVG
jgi:protein pelota